jgi:hypothetical protein
LSTFEYQCHSAPHFGGRTRKTYLQSEIPAWDQEDGVGRVSSLRSNDAVVVCGEDAEYRIMISILIVMLSPRGYLRGALAIEPKVSMA